MKLLEGMVDLKLKVLVLLSGVWEEKSWKEILVKSGRKLGKNA